MVSFFIFVCVFLYMSLKFRCYSEELVQFISSDEIVKIAQLWSYDVLHFLFSVKKTNLTEDNITILVHESHLKTFKIRILDFFQEYQLLCPLITDPQNPIIIYTLKLHQNVSPDFTKTTIALFKQFNSSLSELNDLLQANIFTTSTVSHIFRLLIVIFIEFSYIKTIVFQVEILTSTNDIVIDSDVYFGVKDFINQFSIFLKSIPIKKV